MRFNSLPLQRGLDFLAHFPKKGVWKGKNGNFTTEKPSWYHFNKGSNVDITNKSCWYHVSWYYAVRKTLQYSSKNPQPQFNNEKTSDNLKLSTLWSTWPIRSKIVNIMKNKERLRNCRRLKETWETWTNVMRKKKMQMWQKTKGRLYWVMRTGPCGKVVFKLNSEWPKKSQPCEWKRKSGLDIGNRWHRDCKAFLSLCVWGAKRSVWQSFERKVSWEMKEGPDDAGTCENLIWPKRTTGSKKF